MKATRFALCSSLVAACLALPCRALADHRKESPAPPDLGKLPLAFEENRGQAPSRFDFVADASGGSVALSAQEVLFVPTGVTDGDESAPSICVRFDGSAPGAQVVELKPLAGTVTRLFGRNSARWVRNAPTHASVRYGSVWPGIDIVHTGEGQSWRYDFVLAPGADPRAIRLTVEGADEVSVAPDGALLLTSCWGTLRQERPTIYQQASQGVVAVPGGFELVGERTVGFSLQSFDRSRELVIDPTVTFQAIIGGAQIKWATHVQPDGSGGFYVAGRYQGGDFPFEGLQLGASLLEDNIFLLRFDASGGVVWTVLIGGSADDEAGGLAVDLGTVYLAGTTQSLDFPVTAGTFQTSLAGSSDAFLMRLDPALGDPLFSTYLGGSGAEEVDDIAVDVTSEAVLVGDTTSTDLPTHHAHQTQLQGPGDAFVARVRSDGSGLSWSTYQGGAGLDYASGVALDAQSSAVVAGNAFDEMLNSSEISLQAYTADGTIGARYVLPTANNSTEFSDIAIASNGSYVLCGQTNSADIPVVDALQSTPSGGGEGFVMVYDPDASQILFSTYWGGSQQDEAKAVVVDGSQISVLFSTTSADIRLQDEVCRWASAEDTYVARFSLERTPTLDWATYLPGGDSESPFGMAPDGLGGLVIVGEVFNGSHLACDQPADWIEGNSNGGTWGGAFVTYLAPDHVAGSGSLGFALEQDDATYGVPYPFFVYRRGGNTDRVSVPYSVVSGDITFPQLSGTLVFNPGSQAERGVIEFPLPFEGGPVGSCSIVLALPGGEGALGAASLRTLTLHEQGEGGGGTHDHSSPSDNLCVTGNVLSDLDSRGGLDGMRAFRDQVLSKSSPGRWFVREYYRASPKIVRWLEAHPWARLPARAVLLPVALACGHPARALVLFLAFAAAIAARKRLESLGSEIALSLRSVRLEPATA